MDIKEIQNPLLNEKGQPDFQECVDALLRYGNYWYDPNRCMYFAYTGKYWKEVNEVLISKRLSMLIGDTLTNKVKADILSLYRDRVSLPSEYSVHLPEGLLNLQNGILRLEDLLLLPHSEKRYFFNVLPVSFDPEADCPQWLTFLNEIMLSDQELIKLLQEMVGYCLIPGNWLQTAFVLFGEGENGKSVLLTVVRELLGDDNTSSLSLSDINDKFRRVNLLNKYANLSEESPSGRSIESDIFKNLAAGGRITAERKFKPAFEFNNMAKLIFAANEVPIVRDHTHAFYRRLQVIPFKYQVPKGKKDNHLSKKLIKELTGILNWAIEGLKEITENESLSSSSEANRAKETFVREGDSVKMFIDDRCAIGETKSIVSQTLYGNYREYCESNGFKPCANNQFGMRLRTHVRGLQRTRNSKLSRQWVLNGISLGGHDDV